MRKSRYLLLIDITENLDRLISYRFVNVTGARFVVGISVVINFGTIRINNGSTIMCRTYCSQSRKAAKYRQLFFLIVKKRLFALVLSFNFLIFRTRETSSYSRTL